MALLWTPDYVQTVQPERQAIIRRQGDHGLWYAVLADGREFRNGAGQLFAYINPADLWTFLVYCGFTPCYESF